MLVAVAAGTLAVVALAETLSNVQTTRIHGRYDSCQLLKGVALQAAGPEHRAAVLLYIASTPLRDCNHYAHEAK
jgi:hypothetical protein